MVESTEKAGEKQQKPGNRRVEVDTGPEEGEVVEEVCAETHLYTNICGLVQYYFTYFDTEIFKLSVATILERHMWFVVPFCMCTIG